MEIIPHSTRSTSQAIKTFRRHVPVRETQGVGPVPTPNGIFFKKTGLNALVSFFFKERLGVSKISNPEAFIGDLERFFAKGSVSKHILSFNQKMCDAFGANPRRVFLFFIFFGCRFWFVMKRDVSFIFGVL